MLEGKRYFPMGPREANEAVAAMYPKMRPQKRYREGLAIIGAEIGKPVKGITDEMLETSA